MGEKFAWFFDIALIGVLLICIYNAGKKGFVKSIILLIGYVVSMVGGFLITSALSPIVYEKFVQSRVEKAVEKKIDNIDIRSEIKSAFKTQNINVTISDDEIQALIEKDGDLAKNFADFAKQKDPTLPDSSLESNFNNVFSKNVVLDSIKDKVPDSVYNEVKKYLDNSKNSINNIIKALNNPSKEEGAKELTAIVVEPFVLMIIKIIVFIIAFSLLMFIVRLVSTILSKSLNMVPLVGPLNTFLGGALGFAQGAIIIIVAVLIIKLLVSLTNNQILVFNTPTIEETYIFKHVYDIKLFK